jgi:amino-acid N-acetyltransferase
MRIRLAASADLPAVVALLRSAELPADDLAAHAQNVFVAERDGVVIGAVGLEDHGTLALLRSLVVAEDHRGHGLARLLCDAALARAATLRLHELYLLTLTAEDWFARRGWVTLSRDRAPLVVRGTRQFGELCPDTAVLMRLVSDGGSP